MFRLQATLSSGIFVFRKKSEGYETISQTFPQYCTIVFLHINNLPKVKIKKTFGSIFVHVCYYCLCSNIPLRVGGVGGGEGFGEGESESFGDAFAVCRVGAVAVADMSLFDK